MADIAKSGTPSLATVVPCPAHHHAGLLAGEAIAAGDMCYVKSDGKVWRSIGTAANAAAKTEGIALQAAAVNEGVSIYADVTVRYGAGLTPGARYYIGAAAGALADAATTGGTAPVAYAVDATRIFVMRSRY